MPGKQREVRSGRCGCSSTVEPQPSKLMTRVRVPSPAPLSIGFSGIAGNVSGRKIRDQQLFRNQYPASLRVQVQGRIAHIAQLVEHFLGKEEVTGSTPVMSSTLCTPGQWILRRRAQAMRVRSRVSRVQQDKVCHGVAWQRSTPTTEHSTPVEAAPDGQGKIPTY